MKLIHFEREGATHFGLVRGDSVLSFESAMASAGRDHPELASIEAYLESLPRSFDLAREVDSVTHAVAGQAPLGEVRLLPPVPHPPAMLDFGLSPRHLRNSALTLVEREWGTLARALLAPLLHLAYRKLRRSSAMPYYKCNHNAIIGDGDTTGWPRFTSYLDIEPELAVVTGTQEVPIAGYLILNDLSARDVQLPEMFAGGPARCKDFERSKGLGPFLVTPDEISDPLALDVDVKVGERFSWRGSTSEYKEHPDEVVRYLRSIFSPRPGTILGMGTIPDCTGLDNDQWLCPGDAIEIRFTGLGTLHQRIPTPPPDLERSRWKSRPELQTR